MEGLSDGRPPDKSAKRDEIILGDKSSECTDYTLALHRLLASYNYMAGL